MAENPNQTILTIGLELEMIVQNLVPRKDECINLIIAENLREGLSVSYVAPFDSPSSFYKAPATHVGTAKPMLVALSPYGILVVDWKPFTAGVEVRTPILRLGSWRFAVEGIPNTLSTVPDTNIRFTEHCGLHVHIGRRGGFDLLHVKGLAKAVVIFEEEIENGFHPDHRRRGGIEKKLYADSNRHSSISLKRLETTLEMVKLIKQQDTVSDVRSVICDEDVGHRDSKYNFQSLAELRSIEFGQAQGTLDEKWVLGWIEMLIAFVRASELVSEVLFEGFAEAVDNGENGLGEFLAWGVGDEGSDKSDHEGDTDERDELMDKVGR